jgi:hypothetical protein
MKHLITLMAVFLLMGCQTNNNTPKDIISPAPVANVEKKEDKPVIEAVLINKPLYCGPSEQILMGILNNTKEQPILMWNDETHGHKVMVFVDKEAQTTTVLEWPNPQLVCFLSTGVGASTHGMSEKKKESGLGISNKRVLTLH